MQIILILFVANVALSLSSWQTLRSSLPWIKNIRQSSEIKVRHFVQFSPQTYIVARTLLPVTSLGPLSITTISFGSVSLFGVLSEFLQSFSPSRIASKMDVFWDLLASLFGLIVFWGFHLPRISSSRATRRILRYFILATVVTSSLLLLYQELINAVPFNDSFRVVQAGNSPHFNEPSYWSYILTHLNNEGRQYRPLSHFVFYGLLSQIFPKLESPTIFWLGISLVVTFVLLLYELLNRLVKSSNLSLFVCYLTPLHPVFIRNINNAHHLAKYLPPLLMLTSFLLWVEHKKSTTIMSGVLGAGWLALCMGFHEGSFVFSFLILGWMIYRKIELNWPFILSLLFPSLFYGYMRLFKWGIPESGFMAVDVSQIPLGMSYYISVFFLKNSDWWVNRGDALFGTLATILFLLISYLLLKSSSKNRYWILPCLLFLAILPFAGLKNHFDWNRGIWAYFILTLILALCAKQLLIRVRSLSKSRLFRPFEKIGIISLMVLFLVSSNPQRTTHFQKESRKRKAMNEFIAQIQSQIVNSGNQPLSLVVEDLYSTTDNAPDYDFRTTADALAHYFPYEKIVLRSERFPHLYACIENGFPLFLINTPDHQAVQDNYGYRRYEAFDVDLEFKERIKSTGWLYHYGETTSFHLKKN